MRSLSKLSRLKISRCPLLKERCTQQTSSNSEWAKISHIPDITIGFERPSNSRDVQKDQAIPTLLESLEIRYCRNLSELPEYLYELQKLRDLTIENCPSLMSLPVPAQRQQRLTSLKKLHISDCDGLSSLPCELLEPFASLEVLYIEHCWGLTSIPAYPLMPCASLRFLVIMDCSGLTNLPIELLNSCISLENLGIIGCDSLTNVPTDFLRLSSISLQSLRFSNLRNLNSLTLDLQQMSSLSYLELLRLPKLITLRLLLPSHFSKLSTLVVSGFSDSVEFDWSTLSSSSSSSSSLNRLVLNSGPIWSLYRIGSNISHP